MVRSLRRKLSPGARKSSKSPFEKYRGIGSPGIRRGKRAVVRWVRELRGR